MNQFLAENDYYRVYSISENVYLRDKTKSNISDFYSEDDKVIAHHYGDPTGALIIGSYIVIVGHGVTIYPLNNDQEVAEVSLFNEPENQMFTNGLFINQCDQPDESWEKEYDQWLWFKFVSENKVYTMNARTHELKLA